MSADGAQASPPDAAGQVPRASRIECDAPVLVSADCAMIEATACDVSEQGLKLEVAEMLPAGRPVSVKLPGLPFFTGEVRWHGAGHAGLRFLKPIPRDFLVAWVNRHGTGRAE